MEVTLFHKEMFRAIYCEQICSIITTEKSNLVEFQEREEKLSHEVLTLKMELSKVSEKIFVTILALLTGFQS